MSPVATQTQARDEILTAFRTAWELGSPSAGLPLLFDDVADKPPDSGAWARAVVRHATGGASSLSGETGLRIFTHRGTVTVQVFTPRENGLVLNDQLTRIAKNSFEGVTTSPGRVMFRNARVNEVGPSGQWFQTNVFADFEYDEVR